MLELEKAIDTGMPYNKLKEIYIQVKHLQYECMLACLPEKEQLSNFVLE